MSLTGITWTPINSGHIVNLHNASAGTVWDILCKTFATPGANQITLTRDDCGKLDAMHAVTGKEQSVYSELSELLVNHMEIEIQTW
jgi:hypothetical protein